MDYAKLTHLNGVYLRQATRHRLAREVMEILARRGVLFGTEGARRVRMLMPQLKERAPHDGGARRRRRLRRA